jgi:hypothetical protein
LEAIIRLGAIIRRFVMCGVPLLLAFLACVSPARAQAQGNPQTGAGGASTAAAQNSAPPAGAAKSRTAHNAGPRARVGNEEVDPRPILGAGPNEWGAWVGYSFGSPPIIAVYDDRKLSIAAFRWGRVITEWRYSDFEWTIDVMPLAMLQQPNLIGTYINSSGQLVTGTIQHPLVYGGGVNPIGMKWNFRRRSRWQPFISPTAGFIWSVKPVPLDVPGGTAYNFDFDFQVGMQRFNARGDRAWSFGAKWQHISNAFRTPLDPGIDNLVFSVGYSFFK